MPPDLSNDQELSLKKRARRRLVGAIALVLLMVIVLPMILQDHAALVEQEAIKITMSEPSADQQVEVPLPKATESMIQLTEIEPINQELAASPETVVDKGTEKSKIAAKEEAQTKAKAVEKAIQLNALQSKETALKASEPKAPDVKIPETKTTNAQPVEIKSPPNTPAKTPSSFTVQIGVYSGLANIKQLQEKSKLAGYKANIETISTPKGEKYRLRTGNFVSRESAADALVKLQAVGLSGMVIGNE